MSASYEQIQVEATAGLMRLTLNRPKALNPLSMQMTDELRDALATAEGDEAIRAVLITGAGRAFSSGADLGGDRPMTPEGKPDVLTGLRERYNPLILALRELPLPVVAAINGPAAGVGCSMALACDQIVASRSSYLLMAFANIGLSVDGGASAFLVARAGLTRATRMAMLAERIPAEQAFQWGLVDAVVEDDQLVQEAVGLAERLAAGPTRSYAASKRLLNAAALPDLKAQLDREAVAQQEQAESEDFGIGVGGFLTKQTPAFKGK